MTDKDFVEFFNNLIEASCRVSRRGCSASDQPTDFLEEVEEPEDVGLPWGF